MSHHRHPTVALFVFAVLSACSPTRPGPDGNGTPTSPSARRHTSIAYDAPRQRVLLYGGFNNNSQADLTDIWSWDGSFWTRIAESTGIREIGTQMYSTPADVFRLSPRGAVARLSGTQWIQVSGAATPDRTLANLAYDTNRGRLVRYGGGDAPGQAYPETWEFDGVSWSLVSTGGPPTRRYPSMAYDSRRGVTVLFGGQTLASQHLNDTWEWNGSTWTEVSAGGPPARFGGTMVFDEGAGEMLLFGGSNATSQFNDLWRRTGGAWTQIATSGGPSARSEPNLAYDAARRHVVLFGGESGLDYVGDTWIWNGQTWTAR
jgi:hypothetical protein